MPISFYVFLIFYYILLSAQRLYNNSMSKTNSNNKVNKQNLERLLRKYNNNLVISGVGVLFFGLWSVLKLFEEMALGVVDLNSYLMSDYEYTIVDKILYYIFFFIIVLVILLIHYIIGSSSIKVGLGKKRKFFYLFLTAFSLVGVIGSLSLYFTEAIDKSAYDTTIASFLVDIALSLALIDVIVSSFAAIILKRKLRRL